MGWGVRLSRNVGTDPLPSNLGDFQGHLPSQAHVLLPRTVLGDALESILLTCPLVSGPWNKNFE